MIKGIDSYHGSPELDYNQLKKDGFDFVMMKACEGKTALDEKFQERITKAKTANLLTGAYGFARPGSSKPEEEAQTLINRIKSVGGVDLPPMLDMEDNGGLSDSDLCVFVTKWRETIQKEDQRKPILYCNVSFYNKLKDIVKDFVLWIAEYEVKEPKVEDYSFWQYSDSETIQGGKFDGDYFNGTIEELNALCQKEQIKKEEQKTETKPEPKETPKSSNQSERKIYQIQSGDVLSRIALKFYVPLQVLARYNNIENPDEIKAGAHLRIPKVVQVRSGDTVFEYARANQENVSFIGYVNSLDNVSRIYVGQTLYV